MAKSNCKPSPKVSNAGKNLATSKSSSVKSNSAKTLVNHKNKLHK